MLLKKYLNIFVRSGFQKTNIEPNNLLFKIKQKKAMQAIKKQPSVDIAPIPIIDDKILDYPWDFRVSAWGDIRLLGAGEYCPNEIVFRVDDKQKEWLEQQLKKCPYKELLSCVSTPNLPAWRLRKWLKEKWDSENLNKS